MALLDPEIRICTTDAVCFTLGNEMQMIMHGELGIPIHQREGKKGRREGCNTCELGLSSAEDLQTKRFHGRELHGVSGMLCQNEMAYSSIVENQGLIVGWMISTPLSIRLE